MPQLGLGLGINRPQRNLDSGVATPIADYNQRLTAAGGSLSNADLNTIDTYGIQPLRTAGIYNKIKLWHLFYGNGVNTHKVPIAGSTNATLSFYSNADCTPNGITGDGVQKFIVLNETPSSLGLTDSDTALTVYGNNLTANPVSVLISSNDVNSRQLLYTEDPNKVGGTFGPSRTPAYLAPAEGTHFLSAQAPNGSYELIYGDGGELEGFAPNTDNATRLNPAISPSASFYLALAYYDNQTFFYSPATLRSLLITRSLTKSQTKSLYTILDQLNARLGRSSSGNPVKQLDVLSPEPFQAFQRDGNNQADIRIEFCYGGTTATAIEAQFGSGAWQQIASVQKPGVYTGFLQDQPVGQETLRVRLASSPTTIVEKQYVTIGSVVAVLGQSNAAGMLATPNQPSTTPYRVVMHNKLKGWRQYSDPSAAYSPSGSIYGKLADRIMADGGVPVAFILVARGSTNLVGGAADWNPDTGLYYEQALYTIQQSGVNGLEAVLWYQGEGDAFFNVPKQVYLEAIADLKTKLAADLGMSNLKMIAPQIGYYSSASATAIDDIRGAIAEAWDTVPSYLWGPPLWDYDLSSGDGAHWITPADAEELTDRIYRAIQYHCYGSLEGRAPRYESGSYKRDSIDILLQGGTGGVSLGASPATGFSVTDANGARAIESVELVTGGLRLTVDQNLTSPVNVSLGSGNTGAGNTIKDSGAIAQYPIEPFSAIVPQAPSTAPSMSFGDSSNSQYIPLLFGRTVQAV